MSLISSKSNLSALTAFLWHSIVGLKWLQSQIWYVFYPNVPLWPDAENSIYDLRMVPKNGVGLAKLRSRLLVTNVSVAATWGPPDPNIGAGGEVRKWFPGTTEDWRSVMQESTQLPLREKFWWGINLTLLWLFLEVVQPSNPDKKENTVLKDIAMKKCGSWR